MTDELLNLLATIAREARAMGCTEADLRAVDRTLEWITVKNGAVESHSHLLDQGIGIRVRIGSATGYAASPARDAASIRQTLSESVRMAKAVRDLSYPDLEIAEPHVVEGSFSTAMPGGDPFELSPEERIERLIGYSDALNTDDRVVIAKSTEVLMRRRTRLATLHGTRIDQTITIHGGGLQAIAQADGQVQRRSYPKSDEGNVLQGGREVFDALQLDQHVDRIREEAVALCYAPPCPDEMTSVILDGDQLSLQIHESCGHPTEGDRALREELSLAGSSFLTPERMREGFRYGSERVNLVADATTPLGPGTFAWDDEGTPAGRVDLVREGIFQGYLTSRATSKRIGCAPIAACRAESWSSEPIVRMVNINLEPGTAGSLDDLISSTDKGILMSTNRSWSIDDHRLNFQFGCELAREIKGGKLGQLYRNPVYTGITPEFWAGCDAICGPEAWQMWGWFFCGKGDPAQIMHVGHGAAPARFQNVHVCSS